MFKKIGIVLIALLIITGCGKVARESGSSGGSSGGGSSGGSFSVSGTVEAPSTVSNAQASLMSRIGSYVASIFISQGYAANNLVANVLVKAYEHGTQTLAGQARTDANGAYSIPNLYHDKVYDLVTEYIPASDPSKTITMRSNVYGNNAPQQTPITPISTLVSELIKHKEADADVAKSNGNAYAYGTLKHALKSLVDTETTAADALIQISDTTSRSAQLDTVCSTVKGSDTVANKIKKSAKASNSVLEFYQLPVATITIDGAYTDWAEVPPVWTSDKNVWETDATEVITKRDGGLIGELYYAINASKTKMYFMLKLKNGEAFTTGAQYGIRFFAEDVDMNTEFDESHTLKLLVQTGNNPSSPSLRVGRGGDWYGENSFPTSSATINDICTIANNASTGILEAEIDIAKLKEVVPAYSFANGLYKVGGYIWIASQDSGGSGPWTDFRRSSTAQTVWLDMR